MDKRIFRKAVGLLLAALLLPSARAGAGRAGVGWRDGIAERNGKAKTVAELAAMYDSSSCIACHGEIHAAWSRSVHARSLFGTGRTAATFASAIRNGLMAWPASGVGTPDQVTVPHLMICAKCHLPQLADAEDTVARELVAAFLRYQEAMEDEDYAAAGKERPLLQSLNINCLVCHNRNAIIHKWADGYPKAGEVYGRAAGNHPASGFPVLKKSPVLGEAVFCGQCHGLGPNLESDEPTQCATAYGSYLWVYKAGGGRDTCADCHMRRSGLGHDVQSYRDKGMQKAALDFDVRASASVAPDGGRKAVVKVSMTNRAGHSIPDG
jgi:hypothetical protein